MTTTAQWPKHSNVGNLSPCEVGGVGKNKLGELLMEVRAELAAAAAPVKTKRQSAPKAKAPTKRLAADEPVAALGKHAPAQ